MGYVHQSQSLGLIDDLIAGRLDRVLATAGEAESFEDWPWILLYRELDHAFPGSKFILTVRDPDRWLSSYRAMLDAEGKPDALLTRYRSFIFGQPFESLTGQGMVDRVARHNREVREYFTDRPDDLLVVDWEKGDGWAQLSAFLGRPAPELAFPHLNRRRRASS